MFRKRVGMLAVASAAVVGALSLTACSPTSDAASSASTAAAAPAANAPAGQGVALQAPAQNMQVVPGTAQNNDAPSTTGDLAIQPGQQTNQAGMAWTELNASRVGNLPNVVVNAAGFTLYRFDKDTPNPSKSNCNDDCAKKWPPVIINPNGKVFLNGVDMDKVGAVKRSDGSLQLTINGWAVYRFSGDLMPGQANGQGVMGTWFAVTPDGGKASADGSGTSSGTSSGTGSDNGTNNSSSNAGAAGTTNSRTGDVNVNQGVRPATNAVLFDDKNLSVNSASQGISGTGCQNVFRPDVASSIETDGSLKLWTGKDCTGTSKVINGSVKDLGTLGLDDQVTSVKFS